LRFTFSLAAQIGENAGMRPKEKPAAQREAARQIAGIMYESLRQLPKEERDARVAAIQKIKIRRKVHES
jgi:hypothetical protein